MIKAGLHMLGNGVHRMKIRGWMIGLSIALFATRFSGQKRGDLAAFEKALAEIAAESRGRQIILDHISFYVSIGHFYCQLKQSRGGGPLNGDNALEILHQGDPRTQQNPQDVIFQG